MPWTENQKQAINIGNKNILVSAAAGSGKTAILVERIVSRILNKDLDYSLEDLLVMTFTKLAAANMKDRIKKRLNEAVKSQYKNDKKEYKRLKNELNNINISRISTIDSFCLNIIRENIDKLDIDPNFNIGNEEDINLLKAEAIQELLEEKYEEAGEDFLFLLDIFSNIKGDDGLISNIDRLYEYAWSMPRPYKYLDFLLNDKYDALKLEEIFSEKLDLIIKKAKDNIKNIDEIATISPELYKKLYGDGKKTLGIYNKENNEKEIIYDLDNEKDIYKRKEIFKNINFHIFRASKDIDDEILNKVKMLREEYKESIKSFFKSFNFTKDDLYKEVEYSKKLTNIIVKLTKQYADKLMEKKIEKNIFTFNDISHFALSILYNGDEKTDIALKYQKEFKEIYIDEYQDSNYVQEELIKAISNENVFMVGDVKQSIYAFRKARPDLFIEKYERYSGYDEINDNNIGYKVLLSDNFRSRATVLNSINSIFYKIMSKEFTNIEYNKDIALNPKAIYNYSEEENPSIRTKFYYINNKNIDKNKKIKDIELESKLIAKLIRDLIDSDMKIEDSGQLRKVRYSDIVILLRNTKDNANIIAKELAKKNIPAHANIKTGFFETYEIQKLISILTIIDNPSMEIDLCSYLKSPIVDLDDKTLAILACKDIIGEKDLYKAILYILYIFGNNKYNDIFDMENINNLNMEDERNRLIALLGQEKIDSLITAFYYLDKYRDESNYLPLHILIRKIVYETNFIDYIFAMPYGEVRKANILFLIEKAKEYEKSSYKGLFNFIRYLEALKEKKYDFGEANLINENSNVVRIMTIHNSKGLEYPVCILANIADNFKNMDIKEKMLIDDLYQLSYTYIDKEKAFISDTLKKSLVKEKIKDNLKAEEIRLLYVALSRAKDLLIFTSCFNYTDKMKKYSIIDTKQDEFVSTYYLKSATSYLDYILLSKHSNSKYIDYIECDLETLDKMDDISDEDIKKIDIEKDNKDDNVDIEALKEYIEFEYKYIEDTKLKNKFSVSELKRKNQVEKDTSFRYINTDERKSNIKYSPTERGNAYHRFMDLFDFSSYSKGKNISEILMKLYENRLMDKEEIDFIDVEKIQKLLDSNLGKILMKAYEENKLHREEQFYMGLSAKELNVGNSEELVLVQGVVDAYIEDGDNIIIIDYKTDKVKDLKLLEERYYKQLDYYAIAISNSKAKKDIKLTKLIWSFELGEEIKIGES